MNRYLVISPRCAYFVTARDIASAAMQANMWNSVRVIKWMVEPQ